MTESDYIAAQEALYATLAAGLGGATIIPRRTCYANAATCLTIVHMIAPPLADAITHEIIAPLRAIDPRHHWYPAGDLHFTVRSIRSAKPTPDFGDTEIAAASNVLARVASAHRTPAFEMIGALRLPTSLVVKGFGGLLHRDLVQAMDAAMTAAGLPDDKVYASREVFVGNVTICRFTHNPSPGLITAAEALADRRLGAYAADALQLVIADETCSAASRRVLSEARLAGG